MCIFRPLYSRKYTVYNIHYLDNELIVYFESLIKKNFENMAIYELFFNCSNQGIDRLKLAIEKINIKPCMSYFLSSSMLA